MAGPAITIKLRAGTAEFYEDLHRANGDVVKFGKGLNDAGHGGVTGVQAVSGALRVMEGGLTNNLRAAERFVANVLGFGPALQAIFPLVGGAAFGGLLIKLTEESYNFYKQIRDAGDAARGAFRELNAPLKLTNDELQVANDRLGNEIAKLEGKHENTLKLALDEARASADKLAESLDKDLSSMNKLLDEQNVSFWRQLLGEGKTKDIKEEIGGLSNFGGFRQTIADITDAGNAKIREATSLKEKDAARLELNTRLTAAYAAEIAKVNRLLDETQEKAKPHATVGTIFAPSTTLAGEDERARIETLRGVLRQLQLEQSGIGLQSTNTDLTAKRDALQAGRDNAQLDKPFADRMAAISAQIEQVRLKLGAIGGSQVAQNLAKAFGEARIQIEEVNKQLEKHNSTLAIDNEQMLVAAELAKVNIESEATWKEKLVSSVITIEDRIAASDRLTAAIGRGYEATKQANVETRLAQELGQHASDPAFLASHSGEIANLRSGFGAEFEAQHREQTAQATEKLTEQITLERALAAAQRDGAEAVRQAGLAVRLRQLAIEGASQAQIKAEIDLYNASRANVGAEALAQINQKIAATERLTDAIRGGAAAERQAALENKVTELTRGGASPEQITAERALETAERNREAVQAAAHVDRLRQIDDEIVKLHEAQTARGDTLAIEIELRKLENERIAQLVQESLSLRGARDGVRAFFIEMQEDAKSTARVVYDTLNGAVDKVSSNFARLFTHQKTDFAKSFKELGTEQLGATIKGGLQTGLGKLGQAFGLPNLGAGKADGSSPSLAFWVRLAQPAIPGVPNGAIPGLPQPAGSAGSAGAPSGGGLFGGGAQGNFVFSLLGLIPHAEGGGVTPGNAYLVGEKGPEPFIPDGPGTIIPNGAGFGKSGDTHNHFNIDARGADLGAANRIRQALDAVHKSAVTKAVQASAERSKRVPEK
jgi:hypothetical protein